MKPRHMAHRNHRPIASLANGRIVYDDDPLDFWGSLAVFLAALVIVGVVWLFLILLFSL